jgi:hypothetical protein
MHFRSYLMCQQQSQNRTSLEAVMQKMLLQPPVGRFASNCVSSTGIVKSASAATQACCKSSRTIRDHHRHVNQECRRGRSAPVGLGSQSHVHRANQGVVFFTLAHELLHLQCTMQLAAKLPAGDRSPSASGRRPPQRNRFFWISRLRHEPCYAMPTACRRWCSCAFAMRNRAGVAAACLRLFAETC